jgi:hypothetical protein
MSTRRPRGIDEYSKSQILDNYRAYRLVHQQFYAARNLSLAATGVIVHPGWIFESTTGCVYRTTIARAARTIRRRMRDGQN